MISNTIRITKNILRPVRDAVKRKFIEYKLQNRIAGIGTERIESFDFCVFKKQVLGFLESVRVSNGSYQYKYSKSCSKQTLYASVYACMTKSLLGEIGNLTLFEKKKWCNYFDTFQSKEDGLFYDPSVENEIYKDTDWWGARHLALHMISAYSGLGAKPVHQFLFLKKYYPSGAITKWLDAYDWTSRSIGEFDIDNKIMNIGCLLQYQRDAWGDKNASLAVEEMKKYLKLVVNPRTGMWGGFEAHDPDQRSRMVQFAYHIFPIFFYDADYSFDAKRIVEITLKTQNKYGGYGVKINSSACEDIDSIYILIAFRKYVSDREKNEIDYSLRKAYSWVRINQQEDGGFVFRLFEPLRYGHAETSSLQNESSMFPTWFRLLSLAHLDKYYGKNEFVLNYSPGLEYV